MTTVKLSDRLRAVADMVTPGLVLADIGTDHAYIPIYLAEQGIIPQAVAADIHTGPLSRAEQHIREHGLSERIETRISDGLAALHPGEVQSIVIAGMGGALTIRILENAADVLNPGNRASDLHPGDESSVYPSDYPELILQPQSELPQVRTYLVRNGWIIVREDMVFEDGKYYPMMKAKRLSATDPMAVNYDPVELIYGPELLRMRHPVLHRYLLKEQQTLERILRSLEKGRTEKAAARVKDIQGKMSRVDEALKRY